MLVLLTVFAQAVPCGAKSSGLSTGIIAGIAIASIAMVAFIAITLVVILLYIRSRNRGKNNNYYYRMPCINCLF